MPPCRESLFGSGDPQIDLTLLLLLLLFFFASDSTFATFHRSHSSLQAVDTIMSHPTKTPSHQEAEEMEMEDRKDMAGTAKDAEEMDRLGRQQQLNVCVLKDGSHVVRTLTLAAKLPLHLHPRFLQHGNEYVGDCHELDNLRPVERRPGWCGMGIFHSLDGLLLRLCLAGRDGLDVRRC